MERYCRLALLFHVRQATVPDKDSVVMRLIRAEQARLRFSDETTARDYQQRFPADYTRLIASVANEAFDDVVPRFHTVTSGGRAASLQKELDDGTAAPVADHL